MSVSFTEATHILLSKSLFSTLPPHRSYTPCKLKQSPVVAVLTRPADNIGRATEQISIKPAADSIAGTATNTTNKTVYNDGWFDQIAIDYLSKNVQDATGFHFLFFSIPSPKERKLLTCRFI